LISKEKRRGTVYTRTKTSTRDIFLFERVILLCKKKDEGNGKSIQYQFKEIIKVIQKTKNFRLQFIFFCNRLLILLFVHIQKMIEKNLKLYLKIIHLLYK
jgi:hypothetical protein